MANITHATLTSSFLTSAGHDGESTAEVAMANGKTYRILGISAEAFQAFLQAESQGQYFNKTIKGAYTVEPVTADA